MSQTLKQYKFLSAVCLTALMILIFQGPYLQSDSSGYLEASPGRGLFYPLFLNACRLIWDNLHGVVFVQLVLGIGACFYAVVCFSKLLEKNFGIFFQISIFLALAMPYVGHTLIGNTILTEPLAYPLFLLFFCQLLLWRKFENPTHFFISLGLALCLMLTRKQLGFVFAGFYCWIFLDLIHTKKIKVLSLLLPIVFFGAGLVIEKSYMHIKTGHFTSTPSGIFIMASPLYIAKTSDVDLLKTPAQKHFLEKALKDRDKQKLAMDQELYANFTWPYHKKFEIIHDVFSYEIVTKALQGINLGLLEREEFLKDVSYTLIKNNLVSFFKFYYHNVINNMGGYYYFYIVCCAFCACLWRLIMRQKDALLHVGLLATSLQFLNYGIVAIFLPVLRRYAIYTDGLMICFWLLCLHLVFMSKEND
jgi:hypothetical protein